MTLRDMTEISLCSVFLFLIILLAVLGNLTVIGAIAVKPSLQQQPCTLYIVNLAITDLTAAMVVMVPAFVMLVTDATQVNVHVCYVTCAANYCCIIVSMLTLSFIAVDRYCAVEKPLVYHTLVTKGRVLVTIGYSWLQGVAFALPPTLSNWVQYDYWEVICAIDWSIGTETTIYVVCAFLLCFILPAVFMTYCYTRIIRTASGHPTQVRPLSEDNSRVEYCRTDLYSVIPVIASLVAVNQDHIGETNHQRDSNKHERYCDNREVVTKIRNNPVTSDSCTQLSIQGSSTTSLTINPVDPSPQNHSVVEVIPVNSSAQNHSVTEVIPVNTIPQNHSIVEVISVNSSAQNHSDTEVIPLDPNPQNHSVTEVIPVNSSAQNHSVTEVIPVNSSAQNHSVTEVIPVNPSPQNHSVTEVSADTCLKVDHLSAVISNCYKQTTKRPSTEERKPQKTKPAKPKKQRTAESGQRRMSLRTVVSLLVVVISFFICMTPFCVTKLIKVLHGSGGGVPHYVNLMAAFFGYTSCMVNPLLYAILRRDYRSAYKTLFVKIGFYKLFNKLAH